MRRWGGDTPKLCLRRDLQANGPRGRFILGSSLQAAPHGGPAQLWPSFSPWRCESAGDSASRLRPLCWER